MIKPNAAEVYPVYICESCNTRHCETLEYVKKIGKILCGCGIVLELAPIETFRVSPVFKQAQKKIKTKKSVPLPSPVQNVEQEKLVLELEVDDDEQEESLFAFLEDENEPVANENVNDQHCIDEAIELLVSLGWKKREAAKKVDKSCQAWMNEKENP